MHLRENIPLSPEIPAMPTPAFQALLLRTPHGATATLYPHGAHVVSWRTSDGLERLFTSATTELQNGVAIRGGVPVIFPQFAGRGGLPKHGFARTALWQPVRLSDDTLVLQLRDDAHTRSVWPAHFLAEYKVVLSDDALTMTLSVTNSGTQSLVFTAALHTYLRVQDIARVAIAGLQGLHYSDSAAGGGVVLDTGPALHITGEVDRIYFATTRPIQVLEPGHATIECRTQGFADTVVWNPGTEKAAALTDLEPDGQRHMVCVEAAAIGEPVVLVPGAIWSGTQSLTVQAAQGLQQEPT